MKILTNFGVFSIILILCIGFSFSESVLIQTPTEIIHKTEHKPILPQVNHNSVTLFYFVIDSGSSGSRIYVYKKVINEMKLDIVSLFEDKINVPLASFVNHPEEAGEKGIKPLLEQAIKFIKDKEPSVNTLTIKTSVLGTAGMRLIPEESQSKIYANVAEVIKKENLLVGETKTISGQYEGVYSWVDVNYLSGKFNALEQKTFGLLEVGGASAQIVFQTSDTQNPNVTKVTINGVSYNVFAISYLGLGQDVVRNTLNNDKSTISNENNVNNCYPSGYTSLESHITGAFVYNDCLNSILKYVQSKFPDIFELYKITDYAQEKFIGVGAVFFVLDFWKILDNEEMLENKIKDNCSQNYTQIEQAYPKAYNLYNVCANSVYEEELLNNVLKLNAKNFSAINTIGTTSLTWTLGYLLVG